MAEFNLEGVDNNLSESTNAPIAQQEATQDVNYSASLAGTMIPQNKGGLSQEEITDPNAIKVTIDDATTPIVVLFGPPSCGKTMTLVRLTRYLSQHGYEIQPVKTFRHSEDRHYKDMCDKFNDMIMSEDAAASTSNINFMLVNVTQRGHSICQILEAPGEGYYMPKTDSGTFPKYVNNIISSNNRKIWLFLVEPDWNNREDRQGYATKIKKLQTKMNPRDQAIFLFNKIDTTHFVLGNGHINTSEALKFIRNQYPGIFEPFRNENPITRFFSEYRCEFVPFSTGDYNKKADGGQSYEQGNDSYPRNLWNIILKIRKG